MQTTMKEFGGGDENTTWGGLGVGEGILPSIDMVLSIPTFILYKHPDNFIKELREKATQLSLSFFS